MSDGQWLGLMTDADPHDIPWGAMQVQDNLQSLRPGVLSVRKGFKSHDLGISVPTYSGEIRRLYRHRSPSGEEVAVFSHDGSVGTSYLVRPLSTYKTVETSLSPLRAPTYCTTRLGALIRVNGLQRGHIEFSTQGGPLGLEAPAAGPEIAWAAGGNSLAATYYFAFRYVTKIGETLIYSPLSPLTSHTFALDSRAFTYTVPRSTSARIVLIEFFRSTADQQDVLYLVETVSNPPAGTAVSSADSYTDDALMARDALPIFYDDGSDCARRQVAPPKHMEVICHYQDRYFYARMANVSLYDYCTYVPSWDTEIVGRMVYPAPGATPWTVASVTAGGGGSYTISDGALNSVAWPAGVPANTLYRVSGPPEDANAIYYSEIDEPESVPETNRLLIPDNDGDEDEIVALLPSGESLLIVKKRHVSELRFESHPAADGVLRQVARRGALNQASCGVMDGVAYFLDLRGFWASGGRGEEPLSDVVDDYFRGVTSPTAGESGGGGVVVNEFEGVVRFALDGIYATKGRYYCYCPRTKAVWTETVYGASGTSYANGVSCTITHQGRIRTVVGGKVAGSGATLLVGEGTGDFATGATAVAYQARSGIVGLPSNQGQRKLVLNFEPTTAAATVALKLYYDRDASAAVMRQTHTQDGVTTAAGSASVTVNLQKARSALGGSTGIERVSFAARSDARADTHRALAVDLSGTAPAEAVAFYALDVEDGGKR